MNRLLIYLLLFTNQLCLAQIPYLDNKNEVNEFLDAWHQAAADADADTYFDGFAENGVFLGTDPAERWTRDQFIEYAKEAFENNRTWDFKPEGRNVSFNTDYTIAWFDESLVTWMGSCRGSGVLQKIGNKWKIRQYNLAVTIENELITEYLKLIGNH